MIYYLLYPLHTHESLSFLNVLRYVPFRFLMATMTSLLLTFGLYPWFIRRLQRKQIGQVIRADGPESHFAKAGTPTMGGALMLLALVLSTVLWGGPVQLDGLGGDVDHGRVRRRRVHRRYVQDSNAFHGRALGPLQAAPAVHHRDYRV